MDKGRLGCVRGHPEGPTKIQLFIEQLCLEHYCVSDIVQNAEHMQ